VNTQQNQQASRYSHSSPFASITLTPVRFSLHLGNYTPKIKRLTKENLLNLLLPYFTLMFGLVVT